jgi:antitoxin component of MazEF toxin-antitoxin module
MFDFGKRKVTKQGGSYLISLPMQWMQDMGIDLDAVKVEMDSDKSLRIVPAEPAKTAARTASHRPIKESVPA